ncbi:MAG: helix-turn-helix transcriptional regulator [Candidatus Paceibacterota bacterium]|jgi:transcriptional regulator with XRE-family HTH domain|nr:helix-turn-helix transcriptional regulator [Candidatus Paceibacterota bacterium]MDD4830972.1 helix-turn-helix transcriptional regulator [Candidatus Paceibacterota bacterium]MDD4875052.1 helix-turn-helix transcriptional regulator [Candidatus Paceibacterota bacterium]
MSKDFYLSNLKRLREQKGWTQEKLAQESGISYHTLIKIERGFIKDPRLATLKKLSEALDISIDRLVN